MSGERAAGTVYPGSTVIPSMSTAASDPATASALTGVPSWNLTSGRSLNRQRVHALLQFLGQGGIDHAVLLDAGLAPEGLGHDDHAEMALAIGTRTGMTGVVVGVVDDL